MQKKDLTGGISGILILFIMICGCTDVPFLPQAHQGGEQSTPTMSNPETYLSPGEPPEGYPMSEDPHVFLPLELTPNPTLTPLISNISEWNPYMVLPTPAPPLNHTSILKNDTPHNRKILNITYSGSVGLAGNAAGKELNITSGPFSITYTVHPNISSPLNVWTKLTVFDPWQNIIAEGGYNRGYPNQETQTMMIYREGRYYLTIEGDFASVDYVIKTADLTPIVTPTPVPQDMGIEEEFPR